MTIKVKGVVVVDDARNISNVVNFDAQGSVSGGIIATKTQAEAGTLNTKLMTPQRVKQAIEALLPTPGEGGEETSVIKSIQRGSTYYSGPSPITVNLPTQVNINKSFVSCSVRPDISGGSAQGLYGNSSSLSKNDTLSIAAAGGGGASAHLNRRGNDVQLIVQGGGSVTCSIINERGESQGSITVANRGSVQWEVIEFV